MWYEILPTAAAYMTFLVLPVAIAPTVALVWRGVPVRRTCMEPEDKKLTIRDERLSGNIYKMQGLDFIPDAKE